MSTGNYPLSVLHGIVFSIMSELNISDSPSYDHESCLPLFYEIEEEPEIVLQIRAATRRAIERGDYTIALILQDTVDRDALDAYWRAIRPAESEQPTPIDMMAYSLTRSPKEAEAAVDFLWHLNRRAGERWKALRSRENGWRMSEAQVIEDRQWERSALQPANLMTVEE